MKAGERSISFSGCGFLGIYHVGVASALRIYGRGFDRVAGASAGSIAAACFLCECCLGQGTSDVLRMVVQARSTALGPLHPSFRVLKILKEGLRNILPMNAHELCSGRLFVSLTRWSDGKNVLVSNFDTREELIQALLCSCFIPFYCGTVPPVFKGERYIDGGWSDNLPVLGEGTVTVSPFSGESDICPQDADSASLLHADFSGTPLRVTARNLYRLSVALFPPHPEVLSQMCRQGFEDGLRWLTSAGEVSCTRCLEIRSLITLPPEEDFPEPRAKDEDEGIVIKSSTSSSARPCRSNSHLSSTRRLPTQVRVNLAKVESQEREGWLNWLFSFRPVKWARYALIPWTLPLDLTHQACVRLLEWLPQLPSDAAWLAAKLSTVAHFLLKETMVSGGKLHPASQAPRFTCQLAVTELSISGQPGEAEGEEEHTEEFGFSVGLDPHRQGPMRQLNSLLKLEESRATGLDSEMVDAAEKLEMAGVRAWEREDSHSLHPQDDHQDLDSVAAIVAYSRRHDALVSYYYEDEAHNINVFEIFGVGEDDETPLSMPVSRRPSFKNVGDAAVSDSEDGRSDGELLFVPRKASGAFPSTADDAQGSSTAYDGENEDQA